MRRAGPGGSSASCEERGLPPERPSHLLRTATSLLVSSGASAALGVVFWLLAARLFDSAVVGRDAAIIAAMVELSAICQLNLDNGFLRLLPRMGREAGRAVARAYALNAVLALVLGTAFVWAAPSISDDFEVLHGAGTAVAFVAGLALWGVFTLQDAALAALRWAPWVPAENIVFGVVKIAALPLGLALALHDPVYAGWVAAMVLLVVPINLVLFGRALPAHAARREAADPAASGRVDRAIGARVLAQDYAGVVLGRATMTLVPLLVVAVLGASANAWLYIPFTIVTSIDMMVLGIASSVVAEGAYDEARLAEHVRTIVRRFGPLLAVGVAVLVVAAPVALLPFGHDYVHEGAPPLRLLALAILPRAAVFLASAVWRVQGRGPWLLVVEAVPLAVLAATLLPLAHALELPGVGLAWVAAWVVPGAAAAAWLLAFDRASDARPVP